MDQRNGSILFPGQSVSVQSESTRIGPGLVFQEEKLIAVKAGILQSNPNSSVVYLEANQKRYIPSVGEPVLGLITSRAGEQYRVDIGGPHYATLGVLAFEGATKRNRPNLDVGCVVYARVSVANKDMEPEVECIHPATGKGEGMGEVKGGFVVKVSLGMSRRLLVKGNSLLAGISSWFPFEIAVGMNGRVWIKAPSPKETITLSMILQHADRVPEAKVPALLARYKKVLEDGTGE